MNRSILMIISGIHGLLLGALLFFLPAMALDSYGDYALNQLHFELSKHLGIITIVLGLVLIIFRSSSNDQLVKALLLTVGVMNVLGAVLDIATINPQMAMDGYVVMGIQLVLGLAQCWFGWKIK